MPKATFKNESLPFDPITRSKRNQKRKRNSVNKETTKKQPLNNKRSKGGKSTPNILTPVAPKTVVWIGAILKDNNAAYSLYYNLNDKRNLSEKMVLQKNQNLEHVYLMGVLCALEKCKEKNCLLSIYTGIEKSDNCFYRNRDQENNSDDSICNEIKEKIAQRQGRTLIIFKDTKVHAKRKGYRTAHDMAEEKLKQIDIRFGETDVVESLSVVEKEQHCKIKEITKDSSQETTLLKEIEMDDSHIFNQDESSAEMSRISPEETAIVSTSWKNSWSFCHLLSVLTAPFKRSKSN